MQRRMMGLLGAGALLGALAVVAVRPEVGAQDEPAPPQGLVVGFDDATQTYLRWDMSMIAWVEFTTRG